jgi:hypothetical protein
MLERYGSCSTGPVRRTRRVRPWRLRPGPEMVAVIDRTDDVSAATVELWLPVEGS